MPGNQSGHLLLGSELGEDRPPGLHARRQGELVLVDHLAEQPHQSGGFYIGQIERHVPRVMTISPCFAHYSSEPPLTYSIDIVSDLRSLGKYLSYSKTMETIEPEVVGMRRVKAR